MSDVILTITNNPRLLSVENKETFHIVAGNLDGFDLFFYCGGRLNGADKMILDLLKNQPIRFFHSGDLDPDGLNIFNDIDLHLNGILEPYKMDIDTYNRHLGHGYALKKEVIKHLDKFNNEKLKELAAEIRRAGKGVEQEIIEYFERVDAAPIVT